MVNLFTRSSFCDAIFSVEIDCNGNTGASFLETEYGFSLSGDAGLSGIFARCSFENDCFESGILKLCPSLLNIGTLLLLLKLLFMNDIPSFGLKTKRFNDSCKHKTFNNNLLYYIAKLIYTW